MPRLLTKRKAKWVGSHKPEVIRGGVLNNPTMVQARYQQKLDSLIRVMTNAVELEIERFFREPHAKEYFAQDASVASQARIMMNALMKQFNDLFAQRAPAIADQTVNQADTASSAAVHASLKELSGGLSLKTTQLTGDLKDIYTASVAENVALIKSIPQQYLTQVQGALMRSITTQQGGVDLIPFLQKQKGITLRRARVIAKDQTKKVYSDLNAGRMKRNGLDKYIWLHTGGAHEPRPLHVAMSGKAYSLSDPPIIDEKTGQRGKPGDAINCSCRMQIVLTFNDEE